MEKTLRNVIAVVTLFYCAPAFAGQGGTESPTIPEARCAELTAIGVDGVEIVSATLQDGGTVASANGPGMTGPNSGAPLSGLPAFCRVVGHIRPVPSSDIGFEV